MRWKRTAGFESSWVLVSLCELKKGSETMMVGWLPSGTTVAPAVLGQAHL